MESEEEYVKSPDSQGRTLMRSNNEPHADLSKQSLELSKHLPLGQFANSSENSQQRISGLLNFGVNDDSDDSPKVDNKFKTEAP